MSADYSADARRALTDRHERERDELTAKHNAELDAFDDAKAEQTRQREADLDAAAERDAARGTGTGAGTKRFI